MVTGSRLGCVMDRSRTTLR